MTSSARLCIARRLGSVPLLFTPVFADVIHSHSAYVLPFSAYAHSHARSQAVAAAGQAKMPQHIIDMAETRFYKMIPALMQMVRKRSPLPSVVLSQLVKALEPNKLDMHESLLLIRQVLRGASAPLGDDHIAMLADIFRMPGDERINFAQNKKLLLLSRIVLALAGLSREELAVQQLCEMFGMHPDAAEMITSFFDGNPSALDRAIAKVCREVLGRQAQGTVQSILAVFRGDVASISELTQALRLNHDVATALMTLAVSNYEV